MMVLSLVLVALVVSLLPVTALQEGAGRDVPRAVNRADPRPGVDEIPLPPGMALPTKGRTPAPLPSALPRNGYVVGRFTEQGQQVDYTFEAEPGELSLFDFGTWGYARSWKSTARIQILDDSGTPLVTTHRAGETAYRKFLTFVAPRAGVYRIRLTAAKEMFRYTLVRHSDYAVAGTEVVAFGERRTVHGHLGSPGDSRTYRLELEPGQEVALRVANDHPMARKQKENRRRRNVGGDQAAPRGGRGGRGAPAARGMAGRDAGGSGARGAEAPTEDFPDLVVQVSHDGQPITGAAHFVLFTPEHGGTHEVTVTETSAGEGGLFVLELERGPARVEVTGYVGDEEDDPVAGVSLRFLRQPASDVMGETRTDENGEFRMSVLPGTYTVHMQREGRAGTEVVPANIERARELNLVWTRSSR